MPKNHVVESTVLKDLINWLVLMMMTMICMLHVCAHVLHHTCGDQRTASGISCCPSPHTPGWLAYELTGILMSGLNIPMCYHVCFTWVLMLVCKALDPLSHLPSPELVDLLRACSVVCTRKEIRF